MEIGPNGPYTSTPDAKHYRRGNASIDDSQCGVIRLLLPWKSAGLLYAGLTGRESRRTILHRC